MNRVRIFKRFLLAFLFFIFASASVVTGLIGLFFQIASNPLGRSSSAPSIDRPVAASDTAPESEIESLVSSHSNPSVLPQNSQNPINVPITNQPAERVSEIVSSSAASEVLNSDFNSEIVSENDNSPFLSGRDLSFSRSTLSNPSTTPQDSQNPASAPAPISNDPAQGSDPEFVSLVTSRRDSLIGEIQQLPQGPAAPPENISRIRNDENPYPGPTTGDTLRPENRSENHADSTEMALGELFRQKSGYRTESFHPEQHDFEIVSTARLKGECLERRGWWPFRECVRNAPDTEVERRRTEQHETPVVFKGVPEDAEYAVFIEEDQEERLHLRLHSNFIAWRDWAGRNWLGRKWYGMPEKPLIDEITFERNETSMNEMVEWIESRLDPSFDIPEWSLESFNFKSKLFYIFKWLSNNNFFVEIEDYPGNTVVGWKIKTFKNEGDIDFDIFIGNGGKLILQKNSTQPQRLLRLAINWRYLDELVVHLNELILFHTGDFRVLIDHLNTHEVRVEGLRIEDQEEDSIRLFRFDSDQEIIIEREESSGDILVNVEIPSLPVTDSASVLEFDSLDFRISKGTILNSGDPEALLDTYTEIFKKILSVKASLSESGGGNPDWISLFELLNAIFGEGILTEVAPGDDPDPRYIGSYFQIVNTEEDADDVDENGKRMEFLMNFLRVAERESASDTTKKLLFFLRSLLENPDRIEEILDLRTEAGLPSRPNRLNRLIEVVNELLLERTEGSGFSLESTNNIENCYVREGTSGWAWLDNILGDRFSVHCNSFVFQLLDNFRINDFLILYTRVIKFFFHEIRDRDNSSSNLNDIDSQTTLLDFDTASKIFAPENDERNIATLRIVLKEVMDGIKIVHNGRKTKLLDLIWNEISGSGIQGIGRSAFKNSWKASIDELIDRKRDEIIDFFRKIPRSFQILDDLRTAFDPGGDNESRRDNLARLIEEQTSGAISGRLADLVALSFLLVTRSDSDLPENTDPIPEGTESDPELLADLEAILNLEGNRFFSSLNNGNYDEFSWSDFGPGRGIQLREYLKNRTAEIRNILVFNWVNSAERSFTTAVHNTPTGPEVIFHFEEASPRTIDRLNLLISSQIPVPPIS